MNSTAPPVDSSAEIGALGGLTTVSHPSAAGAVADSGAEHVFPGLIWAARRCELGTGGAAQSVKGGAAGRGSVVGSPATTVYRQIETVPFGAAGRVPGSPEPLLLNGSK